MARLVARIEAEQGRPRRPSSTTSSAGTAYADWRKPLWEHDLAGGLRMLRMGVDTAHGHGPRRALRCMLRTADGRTWAAWR